MRAITPYLIGGVVAVLALEYAPSLARDLIAPASARVEPVNVSSKSDRISAPRPATTPAQQLSAADPQPNVTVVAKTVRQPVATQQVENTVKTITIRETKTPSAAPLEAPTARSTPRKIPVGCEPSFSPVASPAMAHHTGRCVS